jgi:hypothetical protein
LSKLEAAGLALGRLDGGSAMLPDKALFFSALLDTLSRYPAMLNGRGARPEHRQVRAEMAGRNGQDHSAGVFGLALSSLCLFAADPK